MTGVNIPCSSGAERLPLVSAVIPTRNRPDLVCRAVRSALAQTYPNLEIVVVIDGPDEATVTALESFKDARVRIVALDENVGGSEARNIGAREARGQYVALLDDDDEWLPTKLDRQIQCAASSSEALVTCRHIQREPGKKDVLLPRRAPLPGEDISDYLFSSKGLDLPLYGPQTSSYVVSKSLLLEVPFRRGQPCHQDWDCFLRIMRKPAINYRMVDEPLCIFHVPAGVSGITKRTNWRESLKWIESVNHLVTRTSRASFIVNQVMYRCDDNENRFKTFRTLCDRAGCVLSIPHKLLTLKWYLFSPARRNILKRTLSPVRTLIGL
jgi:glycosyltransferase involved in cell wall biosynthesis